MRSTARILSVLSLAIVAALALSSCATLAPAADDQVRDVIVWAPSGTLQLKGTVTELPGVYDIKLAATGKHVRVPMSLAMVADEGVFQLRGQAAAKQLSAQPLPGPAAGVPTGAPPK